MFGVEEVSHSKKRKEPHLGYVIVTNPLRYWTLNMGQTEDVAKAKVYYNEDKARRLLAMVQKKYPRAYLETVSVSTDHDGCLLINGYPRKLVVSKKVLKKLIYNKYCGHCAYCGTLIPPGEMVMDKYYPTKGDAFDNLMPCCHACFRIKGGKTPREFQDYIEERRARAKKNKDYQYAKKFGLIVDSARLTFFYLRPEGRALFEENLRRRQRREEEGH